MLHDVIYILWCFFLSHCGYPLVKDYLYQWHEYHGITWPAQAGQLSCVLASIHFSHLAHVTVRTRRWMLCSANT